MDNITTECTDELFIDVESGRLTSEEGTSQSVVSGKRKDKNLVLSIASGLFRFNGAIVGDNCVKAYDNLGEPSNVALENVEVVIGNSSGGEGNEEEHMALTRKEQVKEKHKKRNYKKAPKPPRPPTAPSMDAADLKLVREISAITMKKRARNERLKALKKMKEAKLLSSSSSSSSSPSSSSPSSLCSGLSAMFITVLFVLVILYQGFYSGGSASVRFQGSPEPALATSSLISVQFYDNPSPNDGTGLGS